MSLSSTRKAHGLEVEQRRMHVLKAFMHAVFTALNGVDLHVAEVDCSGLAWQSHTATLQKPSLLPHWKKGLYID